MGTGTSDRTSCVVTMVAGPESRVWLIAAGGGMALVPIVKKSDPVIGVGEDSVHDVGRSGGAIDVMVVLSGSVGGQTEPIPPGNVSAQVVGRFPRSACGPRLAATGSTVGWAVAVCSCFSRWTSKDAASAIASSSVGEATAMDGGEDGAFKVFR